MTDQAIVDWLELRERFGTDAFTSIQAQAAFKCSQSQTSRRLQTLRNLYLITVIQVSNGPNGPAVYVVEGS
jgi:hypothetical protein